MAHVTLVVASREARAEGHHAEIEAGTYSFRSLPTIHPSTVAGVSLAV